MTTSVLYTYIDGRVTLCGQRAQEPTTISLSPSQQASIDLTPSRLYLPTYT